jgi:hypothetical protein
MQLDNDWTRFELNGATYAAKLERDDWHGAPWDEECGHGDVTGWETRDKRPGEMILSEDRRAKRFYDFAGAVKLAKRDGWNAKPYDVPGETKGQRAHKAAMADFNRLRAWCNDDWCYVGVIVATVCPCCDEVQEDNTQSLWGIESDAGEYLFEVAQELAEELAPAVAA